MDLFPRGIGEVTDKQLDTMLQLVWFFQALWPGKETSEHLFKNILFLNDVEKMCIKKEKWKSFHKDEWVCEQRVLFTVLWCTMEGAYYYVKPNGT